MSRLREERGAVAIMMALVICMVLIPLGALAVDLGVQRVARTDMQSVADIVALDLARDLDGGAVGDYDFAQLRLDAQASVCRNQASVGHLASASECAGTEGPKKSSVTFRLGVTHPDQYGEPTVLDGGGYVSGYFEPMALPDGSLVPGHAATDVPTAVQVLSSTEVQFGLANGLPDGGVSEGGAVRAAVATSASSACFRLGSFVAGLDPSNASVLNGLLGQILGNSTLNLAGYQGLASARLSLLDLVKSPHIGVGTVDELLALDGLKAGDLYLAAADVLRDDGRMAEADVFQAASASVNASALVSIADLFALTTATDDVLDTQINAFDLLAGTAFLSTGDHFLSVSNLQAGLPSVGVTNTDLQVIEKPQVACNDDTARTAQVRLVSDAKLSLNIPLVNTGSAVLKLVNPDTGQPDGTVNLHLDAELGGAHGKLTNTQCTPDVFDVDVWPDLATLNLSGVATLRGSVAVDLTVLGVPLTDVDVPVDLRISVIADASKPASATPGHATLSIPPQTYDDHAEVGSGDMALPHATVGIVPGSIAVGPVTVDVLGAPVTVDPGVLLDAVTPALGTLVSGPVSTAVLPLVNGLVDNVNALLTPLTRTLGLNVGGADVYGLPYPKCNAPRLVG